MGKEKAGFLTPKAIANRIKAKGLQKLRWYCQMCQKQCRDENGFKCHTMSESHQRQLLLFAENPDTYIDEFSKDFEDGYLELLSRRFGTKRVQCNIVYQEYIAFKEHVHMNSTMWETLTDFVKHLGKVGKCTVDATEKGWFVQYIDRNPEAIKRQEALASKERMEMDDEERQSRAIQRQIEKAAETSTYVQPEYTDLQRGSEEDRVTFGMATKKPSAEMPKPSSSTTNALLDLKKKHKMTKAPDDGTAAKAAKRKAALDEIILDVITLPYHLGTMDEYHREKNSRKEYWLHEGIIVKITTKKLGEQYYKKKALVKEVKDEFTGVLKILDTGSTVKVDQTHVETVIPAIGKMVVICNGAYRGQEAILTKLHEQSFSCTVTLKSGLQKGRVVPQIQYEDLSKLYTGD